MVNYFSEWFKEPFAFRLKLSGVHFQTLSEEDNKALTPHSFLKSSRRWCHNVMGIRARALMVLIFLFSKGFGVC